MTVPIKKGMVLSIKQGMIDTGGVPTVFAVENQSFGYGLGTPDAEGAFTVKATGGTIDFITIDSVTVGSTSDWENFADDEIRLKVGNTFAASTVISCTATALDTSTDTFTASVTAVPGISCNGETEVQNQAQSTSRAYGDILLLRAGAYNLSQSDYRWKRTVVFTGVFTGTNFVLVTPHVGEDSIIHFLRVDNINDIEPAFRFTGVNFQKRSLSGSGGPSGGLDIINSSGKTLNMKIDNCVFTSEPGFDPDAGLVEIHSGVRVSNGGNNIEFSDNSFADVFEGIFAPGSNVTIERNTFDRIYDDAIRIGGDTIEVNDNVCHEIGPITGEQHGDFIQSVGKISNANIGRNVLFGSALDTGAQFIFLGDGLPGDQSTGVIIEGNISFNQSFNQIRVDNCDGAIIRGNSCIIDPDSGILDGGTANMLLEDSINCILQFNISGTFSTFGTASGHTISDNTAVTATQSSNNYSTFFTDPQAGSGMTDPTVQLQIVASSAPDLADPKHGAHQDYFDYVLHTSNPPYDTPVLTSPVDAANGATASTGSVSTTGNDGTLYWVVTTSSTTPTAAQIKLGQDNTGTAADGDSGNQTVSTTGTQNITPSGLTESTAYTTHFMHEDAATNQSIPVSASGFTTAAASAGANVTFLTSDVNANAQSSYTFSSIAVGAIKTTVSIEHRGSGNVTGVTLGGSSMTSAASQSVSTTKLEAFVIDSSALGATEDLVVSLSANTTRLGFGAWSYDSTTLLPALTDNNTDDPPSLNINIEADGGIIAFCSYTGTNTTIWTGVDEDYDAIIQGDVSHSGGSRNFVSSQVGHTVTATPSGSASNRVLIVCAFKGD